MPGFPVLHYLPEFAQTHVHWVSDVIQPSHPLSPSSPPDLSLSHIRVFSNELPLCIRWPKYWNFSFSISPCNEYLRLISFRIDWIWSLCSSRDSQESFPAPQFESISSLALSLLYCSNLTSIHDYWKNYSLTRWTFVSKGMSMLFNMLSSFLIAFLARSKHILILWVTICSDVDLSDNPFFQF